MNCLRARSRVALLCLLLAFSIAGPGSLKSPPTGLQVGDTWVRPADGMVMVYVPGGEFEMGTTEAGLRYARKLCKDVCGPLAVAVCQASAFADEEPAHRVTLDGFWIDRTEVTNGQYERCVEAGACTPPTETGSYTRVRYYGEPAYADYPVVWVTWEQAAEYAAWAGARLPTEAEWEYAARSPESRIFPWGDTFDGTRLNYCDAACAAGPKDLTVFDGFADTAPVGSFPAGVSWCGALDLAGNVREWVADGYGPYAALEQLNPQGPATGDAYVPKGGSWLDRPDDVRGANRGANAPDYSEHKVGFRCALDAAP
jgi:formylglycine-generating enzyme required for sulfatase activity